MACSEHEKLTKPTRNPIAVKNVLVVDDSLLLCQMLQDVIETQPDMRVIGATTDSRQAIAMANELTPDVITLDLEMPHVSGIDILEQLNSQRPTPVVVVSALASRSASVTLRALDLGAIDYIRKPTKNDLTNSTFANQLCRKLRQASSCDVRKIQQIREARKTRASVSKPSLSEAGDSSYFEGSCIAIGISTGGPPALGHLFENLSPPTPPIVIVQHMPAEFTGSFAERLNGQSSLDVCEAESGMQLKCNSAYVAPGGKHLSLSGLSSRAKIQISDGEPVSGHRPSVDVMMTSAAKIFRRRCLGVIMTGMGFDGVAGCKSVKEMGGYVLGQDQATSAVYGMNKVAWKEGWVDDQFSIEESASCINQALKRFREPSS